jgi:hypothetical protein
VFAAVRFLPLAFILASAALGSPQNPPRNDPADRVRLQPRLVPGQTLRYRVSFETSGNTSQTGLIRGTQGPARMNLLWNATVRLDISAADSATGSVRLRSTYEQSAAVVRTSAFDPRVEEIERRYAQLAGQSVEFILGPDGRVSSVRGLENVVTDEQLRLGVQQWITQLTSAVPAAGVFPGQKWTSVQPADLPLAGLSWRTDSTYLRNEPCSMQVVESAPHAAPQGCAVLLARLALVTTSAVRDPTPDSYRLNGLRTGGRWTGTGESLIYVSLRSGWVVSATQESSEEMDVTIVSESVSNPGSLRYHGLVHTRSQILLVESSRTEPSAR